MTIGASCFEVLAAGGAAFTVLSSGGMSGDLWSLLSKWLIFSGVIAALMLAWAFKAVPRFLKALAPPMGARPIRAAWSAIGLSVGTGLLALWKLWAQREEDFALGRFTHHGLDLEMLVYGTLVALAIWPVAAWLCIGVASLVRALSLQWR